MKKAILFFYDINGTLNGSLENTKEDYLEFNKILNSISEINENCTIIFSLISTEKEIIVKEYLDILKEYLNSNIYFYKQFCEEGYILNDKCIKGEFGKSYQIVKYVEELKKTFDIINIYYADDTLFYHHLLNEYANIYNLCDNITNIIPDGHLGLKEVNALLNDNLKKISK